MSAMLEKIKLQNVQTMEHCVKLENLEKLEENLEPTGELEISNREFNCDFQVKAENTVHEDVYFQYCNIKEEILDTFDEPEFVNVDLLGIDISFSKEEITADVETVPFSDCITIVHQCYQCDYSAMNSEILAQHISENHPTSFKCPLCVFSCAELKLLQVHVEGKHKIKNAMECPYCEYFADVLVNLKCHLNSEHASMLLHETVTKLTFYKCKKCDFKAPQLAALKNHLSVKHFQCVYDCPYCKNKYSSISSLESHFAKHPSNKIYKCRQCDFVTFFLHRIKSHIHDEHTKHSHYKCTNCNVAATSQSNLKEHQDSHHKLYACRYCTFKGRSADELSRHYNTEHEYTFYCPYCTYKEKLLDVVKQHINDVHRGNHQVYKGSK